MPIDRNLEKGLSFAEKTVKHSEIIVNKLETEEPDWFDTAELVDNWFKEADDGYGHLYYRGKLYKLKRDFNEKVDGGLND